MRGKTIYKNEICKYLATERYPFSRDSFERQSNYLSDDAYVELATRFFVLAI